MNKKCIYFSSKDPFGVSSNVRTNFENTKNGHSSNWGSNKHIATLFPRGKCYWKLLNKQMDNEYETF